MSIGIYRNACWSAFDEAYIGLLAKPLFNKGLCLPFQKLKFFVKLDGKVFMVVKNINLKGQKVDQSLRLYSLGHPDACK